MAARRRTRSIERHIDEYDRLIEAQTGVEREIAGTVLGDPHVKGLMTIPGVDTVVAVGLMAAIGRIDRFSGPDKRVALFGSNPSVYQSGISRAHARITAQGAPTRGTSLLRRLGRPFVVPAP